MEIMFGPFDTLGRNRIAQLINKSNQFNLTGRRYSETEVARIETDPSIFTLQVRLRDRFGDNGMISVVICRGESTFWDIDTWLMSCRVLGRGVEMAVLSEIARNASAMGVSNLRGSFIPSGRNDMVRDHYAKLGFDQEGDYWRLDVERFQPEPAQMRVIRVEHDATES
jgi:FkbH-like protein